MFDKEKISVIVPVYNAIRSIAQCVDSVLKQTYENWELLLVDDGSVDDSLVICRQFATKDSRIQVFSKKNGGVSSARNFGIEHASGEYVMFLDSDDYLESNCFSTLMGLPKHSDLVIFSFFKKNGDEIKEKKLVNADSETFDVTLHLALNLKEDLYTSEAFCFPWNKLLKTHIIKNFDIRFPLDIHLREDEIFMYRYIKKCKSMNIISDCLYNYQISTTGLSTKNRSFEEDVRLARYIIDETKSLNCTKVFFEKQIKRAILYYFSAFNGCSHRDGRTLIFKEMKKLRSEISENSFGQDRLVIKIVLFLLKMRIEIFMHLFGMVWKKVKPMPLNI